MLYAWLTLVGVFSIALGLSFFCFIEAFRDRTGDLVGCGLLFYGVLLLLIAVALGWGIFSTGAYLLNVKMMQELCK